MDVTLRQLRYFVAVAEELSFTRAAAELHLSQPALSVQIARLEHNVGAVLLRRTSRSVELTEAGRSLYEDVRRLLADLERAGDRARRAHEAVAAAVRIVHTASAAYEALPLILDELERAEPGADVTVLQGWDARCIDAVLLGEADVALVREFREREGLGAELVRREPLAAALSTRHALAGRERLTLEDLRGQLVVVVPRALAPGFHDVLSRLYEGRGFQPAEVELANPENREPLLAHLARNPDRLFVGPASMAGVRWRGVRHIPIADRDARMGLTAVWAGGPASVAAGRVLDAARRVARREGWLAPG